MRASLVHRSRAGAERTFATAEGLAVPGAIAGGLPGDLDLTLSGPAIESACGDKLVLELEFVSGTSPYRELYVTLLTP